MISLAENVTIQVDGQSAASWDEVLGLFTDSNIYQSWAYGAVRWGAKNLSHLVIRKEGEIVAAAQVRRIKLPVVSAGIAYLRWGPLCQRKGQPLDRTVVDAMINHLYLEYCERQGLSLQMIPNAFLGDNRSTAYAEAFTQRGMHPLTGGVPYRTIVVDITAEPDVLRKSLDQKWRNQLNRSEKNGLIFEVSDSESAYHGFTHLYKNMWERKQFKSTVSVDAFLNIQRLLPNAAKMQIFLAKKDGVAIGALVCSLMGNTAIYLLGATDEKARELKAAYFLQWNAMLHLRAQGAFFYDLGGIDPEGNPGVYHFKSGMSGKDVLQLGTYSGNGNIMGGVVLNVIGKMRRGIPLLRRFLKNPLSHGS